MERYIQEVGRYVHKGQQRDQNEDSVLALSVEHPEAESTQTIGVYAVADGVAGSKHGDIASGIAVRAIARYFTDDEVAMSEDFQQRLQSAVQKANDAVLSHYDATSQQDEMATTIVVAVVIDNCAYVANVGDSRAYSIRQGKIEQITRDHSVVQILMDEGAINAEQAKDHPYRNVVTQVIGIENEVQPDIFKIELEADDVLLLCTDGLTNELTDEAIQDIVVEENSAQIASEQMVAGANQAGGKDNISVILIRLKTISG